MRIIHAPTSALRGIRKGSRTEEIVREKIAMGELSYCADSGLWRIGPFSSNDLADLMRTRYPRERTITERLNEATEDRIRLVWKFQEVGQLVPPRLKVDDRIEELQRRYEATQRVRRTDNGMEEEL